MVGRRSGRLLPTLVPFLSVEVEKLGVRVGPSIGDVHASLLVLLVDTAIATTEDTMEAMISPTISATAPVPRVGGGKHAVRIGSVAVWAARRAARRCFLTGARGFRRNRRRGGMLAGVRQRPADRLVEMLP